MKIVVQVTEAELRGTPFRKYESVLGELIGEGTQILTRRISSLATVPK